MRNKIPKIIPFGAKSQHCAPKRLGFEAKLLSPFEGTTISQESHNSAYPFGCVAFKADTQNGTFDV